MIKTSGFCLSPTEVEDQVSRSGLVADVVAYGVEDDDLGQVVHVAVTAIGIADDAILMAHCRRSMPHTLFPGAYRFGPERCPAPPAASLTAPP